MIPMEQVLAVICLILGFGFVIFIHELGHFLAAKWVGIRVEQFAIGFGHALAAWRKGIGFRVGTTRPEYERRIGEYLHAKSQGQIQNHEPSNEQVQEAATALGLGDTEYRINWIPLGGYVKMLGQDDMNPNAQSDDPRAYNRKSIAARMLVVSAGVIMNVILAAVLFSLLFLAGFRVPPAVIGSIQAGSPAQAAGLQVGDRIKYLDGKQQHDFSKLYLWVALAKQGQTVPIQIERGGQQLDLTIQPQRPTADSGSFLALGVGPISDLRGIDEKLAAKVAKNWAPQTEVLPGDVVTAVNGIPVNAQPTAEQDPYAVFDREIQKSKGKPVALTVRDTKGAERTVHARVSFQQFFGETPFNMAGLQPQPVVEITTEDSPVKGHVQKGDIVTGISINGDPAANPSLEELISLIYKAGSNGSKVGLTVERNGQRLPIPAVVPSVKLGGGKYGLGVQLGLSSDRPVVADVIKGSAADRARVPKGSLILTVNDQPVSTWFDVREQIQSSQGPATITFVELDQNGQSRDRTPQTAKLELTEQEQKALAGMRYTHNLVLRERIVERQTSNPLTAAAWGITETRDLLLQFYVTLHRLTQGSVSAKNFMGPLGIVHTGSLIAFKGWDWLVWFLAMISANLAVVNFLPIPIVDGGLFLFLIIEKIVGRPLSPRMQTVAQLVGLAIILSVFVFVTYQDIHRLF